MNENFINKARYLNIELTPCISCSNPITWSNSDIKIKRNNKIEFIGKTQDTQKYVNGHKYKLCVCEDCFIKKFNKMPYFATMSIPTKWAFQISGEDFDKARSKYAMTRDHMIKKYGEEEGLKKWNDYCEKQRKTNTFEYKKEKYGWDLDKFNDYNKSRAITKLNLIKKYGEEEGLKKWNDYCEKQRKTKSWEYMVEVYGEEEARKINQNKVINLSNLIKKYGEEEGRIRYLKWVDKLKTNSKKRYSYISQKIFAEFKKVLDEYGLSCQYEYHGGEKSIVTSKGVYFLDFYIPELNINIEYNGGVFHADPRLYKDEDHCDPLRPTLTAKQIREHDKIRNETLYNEFGIKIYIIWELDYKSGLDLISYIKNIIKSYIHE